MTDINPKSPTYQIIMEQFMLVPAPIREAMAGLLIDASEPARPTEEEQRQIIEQFFDALFAARMMLDTRMDAGTERLA